MPWLVLAAAFLYASRVLSEGGGLNQSSVIRPRGKIMVDSRLVDDHGHSHPTMTSLRLRAVYTDWLRVTDCDDEGHRVGACAQGLEGGEETAGEWVAGVCEASLYDGMVLGKVAVC